MCIHFEHLHTPFLVPALIFCIQRMYCDFVVWTESDVHIERTIPTVNYTMAATIPWPQCPNTNTSTSLSPMQHPEFLHYIHNNPVLACMRYLQVYYCRDHILRTVSNAAVIVSSWIEFPSLHALLPALQEAFFELSSEC